MTNRLPHTFALAVLSAAAVSTSHASVFITEFMSEGQGLTGSGSGGNRQREFIELTNLGSTIVNTSQWGYNDNNVNDFHAFGSTIAQIAPGESVILTQMTAANFRSYWGLSLAIQVYSTGSLSNLGNADTINIYNSTTLQDASTLVDSLTYTSIPDEALRGSGISRNRPVGSFSVFPNESWVLSQPADLYQSRLAPNPVFPATEDPLGAPNRYTDFANPGFFPIPEPSTCGFALFGLLVLRRRSSPSPR